MLLPGFLLYAGFVLLPAAGVVWLALQRWNGYGPQRFVGLANLSNLWADPAFRHALAHTLAWDGGALGLTAVGLGVALLAWRAHRGTVGLAVLFFPILLPQIVVAAIWVLALSPLAGLVNTVLTGIGLGRFAVAWLGDPRLALWALFVAWAWSSLGAGAVICRAALAGIGREYVELAFVEGAGWLWRLRHVTVPGIRRSIAIAALINLALAGQVFDLIYVTTGGGPGDATMTLPLDMYGRAFGGRTGEGAAVALIQVVAAMALAGLALVVVRRDAGMATGEWGRARADIPRAAPTLGLALLAVLALLPVIWLVGVALGLTGITIGPAATWDPRTWQLAGIASAWAGGLSAAIVTSLWFSLTTVVATLALALPAAFAINRSEARVLRGALLGLLAFGLFQPASVLIIPLFSLLRQLGLLDSPWGVLLPEVARALPVAVLLLWAWLGQLPREILDAAEVDGAGFGRQLLSVAVPLSRPALLAAGVWAFLTSWNEYLLPTVVSQDGTLSTVPTVLATFVGRVDTAYTALAAGTLLAMVPVLGLYLGLHRAARVMSGAPAGGE